MCLLKLLSPHYTPLQKILSLNRFHYFKSPWKDNENTLNFLMCYENSKKQTLKSISLRKYGDYVVDLNTFVAAYLQNIEDKQTDFNQKIICCKLEIDLWKDFLF